MKKLFLFFLIYLYFSSFIFVSAQGVPTIHMSIFYGDGCPHCAKEIEFLEKLKNEFPNIEIKKFEIYNHPDNAKLMQAVAERLNFDVSGVPFLVVGEEKIIGYLNDQTTGEKIRKIVQKYSNSGCKNLTGEILGTVSKMDDGGCNEEDTADEISLPFFGEVSIEKWSLPLLTVVIAAIDGFNPCAMWVLLFLISLLLCMENRKKMWILGIAFIFTSAFVYFLFLSAWLNLFLFLGLIAFVRVLVGIFAIGSGGYHLWEFWKNKAGTCHATNDKRRQKIMDKFCQITETKNFWLALLGIIILAFAVNLIELVCSAGLPAIYTQILSLSELSTLGYYSYLLLYIMIFMLDDLAIFVIAMATLMAVGISTKYCRWANLFGGIIILVLGMLLIFKPGWVMFG